MGEIRMNKNLIDYKYDLGAEFIAIREFKTPTSTPQLFVYRVVDRRAIITEAGIEIQYKANDDEGWISEKQTPTLFSTISDAVDFWLDSQTKILEESTKEKIKQTKLRATQEKKRLTESAANMIKNCAFKDAIALKKSNDLTNSIE
jgi:hypothetical protein